MKLAFLSAVLVLATGFGLALGGCHGLPAPDASFTPFLDEDPYGPGPYVAKPSPDLAVPASPGTVRTIDEPWRAIEGAPSGRIRLLEMYQAAVSERDRSVLRAAELERELEAALARTAEAEKARADLEARNAGLATELAEFRSKALELARRLAQTELALLKAERAELEVRASPAPRSKTP
ncbi:MAG: hypothetical protein ACKVXR_12505 [Planctomycetota bacterium]